MQGRDEFARQLRELGFEPTFFEPSRLKFPYVVQDGRFAGERLFLGFDVPPDFPRTPPPGPNVSPRILPINTSANSHPDKVLEGNFGADWEYWSRPFPGWRGRELVETYMAFIARLFALIR